MASAAGEVSATGEPSTVHPVDASRAVHSGIPAFNSVEMTDLHSHPQPPAVDQSLESTGLPPATTSSVQPTSQPPASSPLTSSTAEDHNVIPSQPPRSAQSSTSPVLRRAETEAIGPATDTPAAPPDPAAGPVVIITLLLTSGARHPYKIDEKYLKKRNVAVERMDPFNISVYTLKELIWRDWREEWDPRPTSPSAIRLIHFGRMLDDKAPLKDCRFTPDAPNVVHMTVKPQEMMDEEEGGAKTGKGDSLRRRGSGEREPGCRCVIL